MSEIWTRLSYSLETDVASSGWQTVSILFNRRSLSDTLTGSALTLTLSVTLPLYFAFFYSAHVSLPVC